jgi:hypothetical protein
MLEMAGENQPQEDDVRDLIGTADNAEPVQTRQREAAPEPVVKEEPKAPREGGLFDDKRMAVAERLKAERRASDAAPKIEIPEEMERRTVGPNVATREDRIRTPEDAQTAAHVQAEDIPAPARRKLKVNGQEVEVDETQITALAQKALASEGILEDAKLARAQAQSRLAEVERLMADHSRSVQQQPVPANVKAEDTKPATNAQLDEIIDRIQTGSLEEGAEALTKFGDQIIAKAKADLGDVDARMTATIRHEQENERIRADTQKTLDSFISDNPDFTQSQRRLEVLFESSAEVMRDNLFAIGVKPELLQGFAQSKGLAPQAAISVVYRQLRSEGHQLPDSAKVLATAAEKVRADFGMPAPRREQPAPVKQDNTAFVAERVERKQAMAPQPRRANVSPGGEPLKSEQNSDDRNREYIRQMRSVRRGR